MRRDDTPEVCTPSMNDTPKLAEPREERVPLKVTSHSEEKEHVHMLASAGVHYHLCGNWNQGKVGR